MEQHERQVVVDQLTTSGVRLRELVGGLTGDQWAFRPGEGRWSINECLEHIMRVEKRIMGAMGKKLEAGAAEPEKKCAEQTAKDVQVATLIPDRSIVRQAPEPVRPTGEFTDANLLLAEFRKTREYTTEFAATTQVDLRSYFLPHMLFGELDGYQWLLALGLHGDRHAKQIVEIKAAPGFPPR